MPRKIARTTEPVPLDLSDGVDEGISLYSFDSEEWFDVCRKVRPDLDRDDFDRMWDDFVFAKMRREYH